MSNGSGQVLNSSEPSVFIGEKCGQLPKTAGKTKKRSQIGIVSQEPILFDSTIRENIQMGNLDVTQEEIDRALVQANAAEFVSKVRHNFCYYRQYDS